MEKVSVEKWVLRRWLKGINIFTFRVKSKSTWMKLKDKDYPRVRRSSQKAISLTPLYYFQFSMFLLYCRTGVRLPQKSSFEMTSACRRKFLSLLHAWDIYRSFSTLSSGTFSMLLAMFRNVKSNGQIQYCFLVFLLFVQPRGPDCFSEKWHVAITHHNDKIGPAQ